MTLKVQQECVVECVSEEADVNARTGRAQDEALPLLTAADNHWVLTSGFCDRPVIGAWLHVWTLQDKETA